MKPKQDLMHELESEHHKDFRKEFWAVRAGVEKAQERLYKIMAVHSDHTCGLRVCMNVALIELRVFKIHFSTPPEAINQKVVTLPFGPEGEPISGVVMEKRTVPEGVPYFEVQLFGEVSRQLHHVLLSPEELRREGQAKDRFKFTMGQMCSKRDASLSCQNYASLPQYTDIAELAKQLQPRLQNEQKVQEIALDARAAQAAIQQVSGSTLEEEDDIAASAASGGQAAVQAPRRLLRGRTTAQQPRRPAGLASTPASSQRTRSASSPTVTSQVLVANDGDGNITESPKDEKEAVELVMGGWNNGREMARVSGAGS